MSGFIFIDVNGTLIPSSSRRPAFSAAWLARFRSRVADLSSLGFKIGLCADSPLPQLQRFGAQIGLSVQSTFPILAENGNVFEFEDRIELLQKPARLSPLRAILELHANQAGLRKLADAVAPEIGGGPIRMNANQWAYGAHRLASLSVFAPREFVARTGQEVADWAAGQNLDVGFDCRPDDNFLAIHPYTPTYAGKGLALSQLAQQSRVLMIGNSRADWVDPISHVRCAFVGDADIPTSIGSRAWYVSKAPVHDGVLDTLTQARDTHEHWMLRQMSD